MLFLSAAVGPTGVPLVLAATAGREADPRAVTDTTGADAVVPADGAGPVVARTESGAPAFVLHRGPGRPGPEGFARAADLDVELLVALAPDPPDPLDRAGAPGARDESDPVGPAAVLDAEIEVIEGAADAAGFPRGHCAVLISVTAAWSDSDLCAFAAIPALVADGRTVVLGIADVGATSIAAAALAYVQGVAAVLTPEVTPVRHVARPIAALRTEPAVARMSA